MCEAIAALPTHLSCVNGFEPGVLLKCVRIDPAHPTLES